jgi:hypothetical protein
MMLWPTGNCFNRFVEISPLEAFLYIRDVIVHCVAAFQRGAITITIITIVVRNVVVDIKRPRLTKNLLISLESSHSIIFWSNFLKLRFCMNMEITLPFSKKEKLRLPSR